MSESEFIKKGVVERETEAQPVKTASDEVFEKVRACTPTCRCNCKANQKGAANEDSK
jgi:hypothetical protein